MARNDKIGIGIAGCGASVWMFGPALACHEDVRIAAWMDPNPREAEKAAARYGGAVYTDYSRFLKHHGLDAVIIASPTWLHVSQAEQAASAGKHVLCEKPMARNASECRQMIDACAAKGVILMVGFMKRFDPAFVLAKEMIDSGDLGEVFEIICDWGWPQYFSAGWRDTISAGGGLLQDHGSHTIDLCRWWVGAIESVSASVKVLLEGREVEDYAHVVCVHKNGCASIHRHSRMTHRPLHECYAIEGSKGALTLECEGQWSAQHLYPFTVKLHRNTGGIRSGCTDISPQPAGALDEQLRKVYSYTRELEAFVDCIEKNRPPEVCRGEDGLAAIEAINAAYLSAAQKKTIILPLNGNYDLEEAFRSLRTCRHIK